MVDLHDGLLRAKRPGIAVVCLFLLLVSLGCGSDSKTGGVHGTVRLDGKPVTTGAVRFVPEAGRAAQGLIQSDGTYRLGTFSKSDGALLGPHKVAVIAYEEGSNDRPVYEHYGQKNKPLVPERYMAIGTSKLTFDVKPGDNQADFDLTSK